MDKQDEKRSITRVEYPVRGQAEYNGSCFQGEIINFSLNGLLFRFDEQIEIPKSEKITMTIYWDDKAEDLQFDFIDYDTFIVLKDKLTAKIGDQINEELIHFMLGSN